MKLNTRIRIQYQKVTKEKGALASSKEWIDIGNNLASDLPKYKYCSWTNSHGSDYLISDSKMAKNKPKIIVKYDPRITSTCRVIDFKNEIYQIVGEPDNIKNSNQFMEIRLERVSDG